MINKIGNDEFEINFNQDWAEELFAVQGETYRGYTFTVVDHDLQESGILAKADLQMMLEFKHGSIGFKQAYKISDNIFRILIPQKALLNNGVGSYQLSLRFDDKILSTRTGKFVIYRNTEFDNGDVNLLFDFEEVKKALEKIEPLILKSDELCKKLEHINKFEDTRQTNEIDRQKAEELRKTKFDEMVKIIEDIDEQGILNYISTVTINDRKMHFVKGNGQSIDIDIPKNQKGGVLTSNANDINIDLNTSDLKVGTDAFSYTRNDGLNLKPTELTAKTLKSTDANIDKLTVQDYLYINADDFICNTYSPTFKQLVIMENGLNSSGTISTQELSANAITTNSLKVDGTTITQVYEKYDYNSDYYIWRTGNIVCIQLRPTVDIGYNLITIPSWARPRAEIKVSCAYHNNNTTLAVWCGNITTSGTFSIDFTTISDSGTIITNRKSGTIQKGVTFTYAVS